MRDDINVRKALSDARIAERNSACCVLNDGSGCLQATEKRCSVRISLSLHFAKFANALNRIEFIDIIAALQLA